MNYLWDNKHFIITHFPIVLLLFSLLFDLAALIWKKREWHSAALICLIIGTVSTVAAVLTGPKMMRNPNVETHAMYGVYTMYLAIALCIVRGAIGLWKKRDVGRNPLYLVVTLAAVVLVMYTAHLGGEMVHRPFEPGQFPQGQMGGGQGQGASAGMPGGQGVPGDQGGQPPADGSAGASGSDSAE
ncbi:DUF2231 domain-containing protein [Paenibacillus cineris]|nr:DUF2231 domain-containing protein [Paenibacillus cineris]